MVHADNLGEAQAADRVEKIGVSGADDSKHMSKAARTPEIPPPGPKL